MVKAMGIEDVPTAPRSPWQNPYIERLIGKSPILGGLYHRYSREAA